MGGDNTPTKKAHKLCQEEPIAGDAKGTLLVDCTKVEIRADRFGGAGAFTAVPIKKGEIVEFGLARRLPPGCGHDSPFVFTWSEDRTIWAMCSGASPYYNTSLEPNTEMVRDFEKDAFHIVALQDLRAEEELTHTYRSLRWRPAFQELRKAMGIEKEGA